MTAPKKKDTTTAPAPEKPKIKYTAEYVEDLLTRLDAVVAEVQAAVAHFDQEREDVNTQIAQLYEQLQEALPDFNGKELVAAPTRAGRGRGRGRGRGSNTVTLRDATLKVLKRAGRKGMSKSEIAQAIKEDGYETTAATDESFENSVYVSGINKLLEEDAVEYIKNDEGRGGRYRVSVKG